MFTMRRRTLSPVEAKAASIILLVLAWNDVVWMLYLGSNVVTGGAQRMSGPGYAKLREIAELFESEPHIFWGTPLLIAGAILAIGLFMDSLTGHLFRILAFLVGALCAGSLFGLFQATVSNNPNVGNTAPPTYLFVASYQLGLIFGSLFVVFVTFFRQGTRQSKSKE